MPIVIPPWLKAPDLAEDYTRGLQIGTQAAEARARISAENTRTTMEAQARQQTLQQSHLLEQARLATETAYKKTQLQLESERLAEVERVNAFKTREAALTLADRQGLYTDLQSGMDPVQAHLRHPRASSVANVENAQKAALDLGNRNLALRQQEFAERQAKNEAERNKMIEIGTERTTEPIRDEKGRDTGKQKVTERKIFGQREPPVQNQPGFPFKTSLADDTAWSKAHGFPNPVASAPTPSTRQAVGKYKIGGIYKGGLKYLGGEPSDESSWQKVQ